MKRSLTEVDTKEDKEIPWEVFSGNILQKLRGGYSWPQKSWVIGPKSFGKYGSYHNKEWHVRMSASKAHK